MAERRAAWAAITGAQSQAGAVNLRRAEIALGQSRSAGQINRGNQDVLGVRRSVWRSGDREEMGEAMIQTVLVCGGRDYKDREMLFSVLDRAHANNPIGLLIHGRAPGADSLAEGWACARGVSTCGWIAEWEKLGKSAGPIRNQKMLDEGKPQMVIAFPGGRGTADMIGRAVTAGVPVVTVNARNGLNAHDPR